jgi:Zn-finger nucleic acid-binding protein
LYCPVCKKAMIILEYNQVELDYCPSCEGCWLDQGELELLLDISQSMIDFSTITKAPRGKKRCPRCRKKMLRENFPNSNIEVDICPRDGGIWLDRGELLEIARTGKDNNIIKPLQEFFGRLLIKSS